jgi:hypothetical protein
MSILTLSPARRSPKNSQKKKGELQRDGALEGLANSHVDAVAFHNTNALNSRKRSWSLNVGLP